MSNGRRGANDFRHHHHAKVLHDHDAAIEGVTGTLSLDGTSGDDTLVITATSADSGTYSLNGGAAVAFSGLASLSFDGGAGNDQVIVKNPDGGLFAPKDGVVIHGGTQNGEPGDGLKIEGGSSDTAIYSTTAHGVNGKDGSVVLTRGDVTANYSYTGLEPLANTGTATNVVFNLPSHAGAIFLENDANDFDGVIQLRSATGAFETTSFAAPTGSLTIHAGHGDTVTANIVNDYGFAGNLTIGSLTKAALSPDNINIGNITAGSVTLGATGTINKADTTSDAELSTVNLAMKAGTGIGVNHSIDLIPPLGFIAVEAETKTGGINLTNTTGLQIGGVTSALDGLKVDTFGDIKVVANGTISLADTDGSQTVHGGSTSGDVTLEADGAGADIVSAVNNHAVAAAGGNVTLQAGEDVVLGSGGTDFDNSVTANGSVTMLAGRNVTIEGQSEVIGDAFGHNTSGGVGAFAGIGSGLPAGNVTVGSDASLEAGGGVSIRTGYGSGSTFTNQGEISSAHGGIGIQGDSDDLQAGSSISASKGTVDFDILHAPVSANLGSTAAGFNFSQAELNTITANILEINPSADITISQSITLDPNKVPTLDLEASFGGSGHSGSIIDGTATEQADLTVQNLVLQALGSIGASDDIDVKTSHLAFSNDNLFGVATPDVNISNTGALTIEALAGLVSSANESGAVNLTTTGALTVGTDVSASGQLNLQTIDTAATNDDLTILSGATVQSGANLFLQSGDNIDVQSGATVQSPSDFIHTINLIADAHDSDTDPDPGVGATITADGTFSGTAAGARGGNDADIFNIAPSAATPWFVGGLGENDTLNVDLAGATNPTLAIGSVFDNTQSGEFTFDNRQALDYTQFSAVNTAGGPLTVKGDNFADSLTVHATGAKSGSFTQHGAFMTIGNFDADFPNTTIGGFGVPDTATYGETITADAATSVLDGFSFKMDLPSTVAFRGEVYAWDGTKAIGPALFESAAVSTDGTGMQVVTFDTGGVALTPGQQYVLFASTSEDQPGHSGDGNLSFFTDNVSSGEFVFLNNGDDPAQWTTQAWDTSYSTGDLAFQAFFDESATVGFTGLTALGFDGGGGDDTETINGPLAPANGTQFSGGDGDDHFTGSGGRDTVNGGAGQDVIAAAHGKDALTGGADGDSFRFNTIKDAGNGASRDVILDFDDSQGDVIDLSGIDAKTGSGNQAFHFITNRPFHHVKGELHYVRKDGFVVLAGDVNGDGKADFQIEVHNLTNNLHNLVNADLIL